MSVKVDPARAIKNAHSLGGPIPMFDADVERAMEIALAAERFENRQRAGLNPEKKGGK